MKCEETFYVRDDQQDPLRAIWGLMDDEDKLIAALTQFNDNILAKMGKKCEKGSSYIEQWCLFVIDKSTKNGHKIVYHEYFHSLSKKLHHLVKTLIPEMQTSLVWNHMLFLLHRVFPAALTPDMVWTFTGKFIDDKYQIRCPVSVLEVMMNLLHAYHILLSWYQLNYATRNFWKIWLEWCWLSDTLAHFIKFVRSTIKKFIKNKKKQKPQRNRKAKKILAVNNTAQKPQL